MIQYSQKEFATDIEVLANSIDSKKYTSIYAIPRGGIYVGIALSTRLSLPLVDLVNIHKSTLIVDDLVDSGATRKRYMYNDFACIHIKKHTPKELIPNYYVKIKDGWIEYFWERYSNERPAEDAVIRLIEMIGEDPNREGLLETPKRVIKSYKTLFSGYKQKPEDIIKTFDADGYNELVLLKDIEIYSMCEHHILPFVGKAHIGYIPDKKVIGISKLARIADMFAKRLQIQERLSDNITSTIMEYLKPVGVACVIEAQHLCMRMRGVGKQNSTMVTSSLKGIFLEDSDAGRAARKEFMELIK